MANKQESLLWPKQCMDNCTGDLDNSDKLLNCKIFPCQTLYRYVDILPPLLEAGLELDNLLMPCMFGKNENPLYVALSKVPPDDNTRRDSSMR